MKLAVPFLQLPVSFDADALAAEVLAIEESWWRPHPNGLPGNSALTLITTDGIPDSDKTYGPMLPTPHLQRCPYLMQVLDAVGATWGRTRLMRLSGQAEVKQHVDINYYWREHVRVHVPIVTQPTVRFYVGNEHIHMAAGECWIFDTWRPHRVVNDHSAARIHLVADTVGGDGYFDKVARGRPAGRDMPGWQAQRIAPRGDARPELTYESVNAPVVMTPWEMREHIVFFLGEAQPHPQLGLVQHLLLRLSRRWQALWAAHGVDEAGWPAYRALLDEAALELRQACAGLPLKNGIGLFQALSACVLDVALEVRRPANKASQ